jgi:hypothetical protein
LILIFSIDTCIFLNQFKYLFSEKIFVLNYLQLNSNLLFLNNQFKMNHSNEAFGIMDEAYFVPRSEILSWVNNLLKVLSWIFRLKFQRLKHLELEMCIVKLWMSFSLRKLLWVRSIGKLEWIISLLATSKFYKMHLIV